MTACTAAVESPHGKRRSRSGRLFDNVLSAIRAEATEKVTMQMQPHCAELALDEPRNEREAVNLACLVDRDRQKEFEQGVIETAALFDDDYSFDFNGPWPPYHFVDIHISTLVDQRSCLLSTTS